MKSMIIMAFLGFAMSAQASHFVRYEEQALDLLIYVQRSCPAEFAKAMEGANGISSATLSGGKIPVEVNGQVKGILHDTLVIVTSMGYFSGVIDIAELTIHREEIPDTLSIPDKPIDYKVTCTVKSLVNPSGN